MYVALLSGGDGCRLLRSSASIAESSAPAPTLQTGVSTKSLADDTEPQQVQHTLSSAMALSNTLSFFDHHRLQFSNIVSNATSRRCLPPSVLVPSHRHTLMAHIRGHPLSSIILLLSCF